LADRNGLSAGTHAIKNDIRQSVTLSVDRQNGFTRAEAGATAPVGPDDRSAISASPETLNGELGGVWQGQVSGDVRETLQGTVRTHASRTLAGLNGSGGAVVSTNTTDGGDFDLGFAGLMGQQTRWTLGLVAHEQHAEATVDAASKTTNESASASLHGSAMGA